MGYKRLYKNLIDIIKEEQAKLGFRRESIRLYYPLSSLNHFFETQDTEEQMKTVVYDSDEDRLSWVLGWFHQVYNKSIGNGSHYIVLVGQEKTKAIYVPSYEMARFFEGIFHVYSIDRGLRKDYCPQDHHFLISAEELTWRKGDPLLCGCGYADQLVALL